MLEKRSGEYSWARYYDPTIGRFLNEDVNKDGIAGSLYMYVENSPSGWIDPFGTSGLRRDPNFQPQWQGAFDGGMASALNALKGKCLDFFKCNDKNLDPKTVLTTSDYRIYPLPDKSGAVTWSTYEVLINQNGQFLSPSSTAAVPSHNCNVRSKVQLNFDSVEDKRAAIILHELGHQLGMFKEDVFPCQNGQHSLTILEKCFPKVKF